MNNIRELKRYLIQSGEVEGYSQCYIHDLSELSYGALQDAAKMARYSGEENKNEADKKFLKFNEIYNQLNNMQQLYIAT